MIDCTGITLLFDLQDSSGAGEAGGQQQQAGSAQHPAGGFTAAAGEPGAPGGDEKHPRHLYTHAGAGNHMSLIILVEQTEQEGSSDDLSDESCGK